MSMLRYLIGAAALACASAANATAVGGFNVGDPTTYTPISCDQYCVTANGFLFESATPFDSAALANGQLLLTGDSVALTMSEFQSRLFSLLSFHYTANEAFTVGGNIAFAGSDLRPDFPEAFVTSVTLTGSGNSDFSILFDSPAFNVVPEPETWAMLLLGFGLIGMRRRLKALPA